MCGSLSEDRPAPNPRHCSAHGSAAMFYRSGSPGIHRGVDHWGWGSAGFPHLGILKIVRVAEVGPLAAAVLEGALA